MDKSNKYFYTQSPISPYPSSLLKVNTNFSIQINEHVDFMQRISLYLSKFSEDDENIDVIPKYEGLRAILKEVFLNKYSLSIQRLSEYSLLDGECYLMKHDDQFFQIEYFSLDNKARHNIQIDFRDSVNALMLFIKSSRDFARRPTLRKKGLPITQVQFKQFLNLSLQFLYDSDSILIFLDSFIKSFYKLINGEEKIESFILGNEASFSKIIEQLENRKRFIEKRLIEKDNDPLNKRIRLRGEIEGIVYAINAIIANK